MDAPPQVIKVKRRYNEEPLPSLIVESSRKKAKLPSGEYVFRLSRTESGGLSGGVGMGVSVAGLDVGGVAGGGPGGTASGNVVGGPPIVRSTLPQISTSTSAATSAAVPVPGASSASGGVGVGIKRKGVPESPLGLAGGVVGVDTLPPGGSISGGGGGGVVSAGTTAAVGGTAHTHSHPPGGKENALALQVPQPRKFHLAHRMGYNKSTRKVGLTPASGGGVASPKKSAIFMEGDGGLPLKPVGGSVGGGITTREKKRRRKRKDEVKTKLSKESLRGLAMTAAAASANASTSSATTAASASTRKRPKVHPREKMELEARRRRALETEDKKDEGDKVVVVNDPSKSPQTQPLAASARGKNAHKHPDLSDASTAGTPARDNVDNDDDELSRQLQQMVLDYLSVQDGVVNLPTEPQSVRKRPSRTPSSADKIGGGVGGGTWEKIDKKDKSEDEGATATEEETEEEDDEEDGGWVYDVYVREKIPEIKKGVPVEGEVAEDGTTSTTAAADMPGVKPGEYGVLVISDPDDEEWFYRGAWDDEDSDGNGVLSDDEDSNAEDYHTNDYPDEEEVDEEFYTETPEGYLFADDDEEADYDADYNQKRKLKSKAAAPQNPDNVAASYLRDLGFEEEDDDDEGNGEDDSDADDDDGDDGSDSYENIYGGNSHKMTGASGGGGGGRQRYAPGEEEYDLGEESSDDDEDTDGVGASELTRLRLAKGVWGYDKPLAVAGGKLAVASKSTKGKVVKSGGGIDSDEDMH
ncbi:hypothetical protein DFH27DRAFT_11891 [Peziza echinospora]|nr:hypothetical protein DFH27DRAFT_11891 [Peziza echinospora]